MRKEVSRVKKIALLLLLAMALLVAMASAPTGWKWDKGQARADDGDGWSWNAQVVSDGSAVTLAGQDSTVTLSPPENADPSVGDTVAVSTTEDDTLLGFPTADGGISWVALGWSWND
jgi:hypothetical protein